MKITVATFLLLFFTYQLSAQEKYWSASTLIYFDNPIVLNEPVQGFIEPINNSGQFISVERNFHVRNGLAVIAGGGFGFHKIKIQDNLTPCIHRFSSVQHFALFSGLSYSKHLGSDFYLGLTGRLGGFYPLQKSKELTEPHVFVTSFCNNLDQFYNVNENNKLFGFINPQIDLAYQLSILPLRVSFGLGAFFSNSNYIEGDLEFNGFQNEQSIEFLTSFSDQLRAVGLSVGLQYVVNQS